MTQLEYLGHFQSRLVFICNDLLVEETQQRRLEGTQRQRSYFSFHFCCHLLPAAILDADEKLKIIWIKNAQLSVCGSAKQEVDTEEEEAALFDKAECCCDAANNAYWAKKPLNWQCMQIGSDNLHLLTIERLKKGTDITTQREK